MFGPLGDDFGDVFLVDFLLQHALRLLQIAARRASCSRDLLLELRQRPYCSSDAFGVVAGALRLLDFDAHLLELLLQLALAPGSRPSPAPSAPAAASAAP